MQPGDSQRWREQGERLRSEGRLDEAVRACRRALEIAPADARAWSELAHALRLGGNLEEAGTAAARAIELAPRLATAWFNRGAVLLALGDAAGSIDANRKAVGLDPGLAEAWSNLAGALGAAGDRRGEIDAYRLAVGIKPELAPAWSNLGDALRESGQVAEAVSACRRAIELDAGFAPAWSNLAQVLLETGENEEALEASGRALALEPDLAEAWSARGGALLALRRYREAADAQRRAVESRPHSATLNFNLGMTLQHAGRGAEAADFLRRAIALEAGHADAHFELSLALLLAGRLPEGWKEYEWRWRRRGAAGRRYDFAPWDGDLSRPQRLLLWGEQGVGDQILHGSMLADFASLPLAVTLEVDRRLVPLFQRSFPPLMVMPQSTPPAASAATHDCHAPLASLGRWLRPSFERFPGKPFLEPDPRRRDEYRGRLAGKGAVIGIAWRSANREFGAHKSTGLRDWLPILQVPGLRFVDLQYGDTVADRREAEQRAGMRIEHVPDVDLFDDLDGLAALCAACDLVITTSNVTAHVAGALGRPVWLLAPLGNGRLWYWFSGRGDSPWYSSLRLFEQAEPGRWTEAVDSVAHELAALARALSAGRAPR
jgi:tetratricopeptide (TPR) repeat protein